MPKSVESFDEASEADRLESLRGTLVGGDEVSDFEIGLEWEAIRPPVSRLVATVS